MGVDPVEQLALQGVGVDLSALDGHPRPSDLVAEGVAELPNETAPRVQ